MRRRSDGLRQLPLLRSCTDRELSRLLSTADELPVAAGRVLVREGAEPGDLYLLLAGRATITRGDRLLRVLGPGDHVGPASPSEPTPRGATVTMVTDGTLLVVARGDVARLLEDLPALRGVVSSS